ncbi:MAG TPA: NUDIX domain-containing protein [Aggregatilineaceae bacterium]|nr:NUDIX domain-containing protein [Aggregatilineaceae bacterium]
MSAERFFRMRAGGIIRRENRILLIECFEDGYGLHYNLPGGGTQRGEPVRAAVRREVREETGLKVEVGRLLLAYEALHPDIHHSFGLLFECHVPPGAEPSLPAVPDSFQIGVVWVPLADLKTIRLLPDIGPQLYAVLLDEPEADHFAQHTEQP